MKPNWKVWGSWFLAACLGAAIWVLLAYCVLNVPLNPPVAWVGDRPTCPAGYQAVADEHEVRAGGPPAHCVK